MIDRGLLKAPAFRPSSKAEVLPFVSKHILPGTRGFSDGLRAYRDNLVNMGYPGSETVSHKEGEYVKKLADGVSCHTNTIDGLWAHIKGHLRYHHFQQQQMELAVYELAWRKNNISNTDKDPFEAFLSLSSA